jgi:hypothetical protein
MASWNYPIDNNSYIAAMWPDSEYIDSNTLTNIFEAANSVCAAFAPSGLDGSILPAFKLAEILQAKHIWARLKSGNRESIGPDGYEISTYPLVLEARGLLRPKRSPLKGIL